MVTFRMMTDADVPAAVAAFDSSLLAMLARHGLPVTGNSIQDERRRQDRTRHFLETDPDGSWVAEDAGTVVGMSQSFVREGYWMLSQLGTVPGRQGLGVGRELLSLALSDGDPDSPGTISARVTPRRWPSTPDSGSSCTPSWRLGVPCARARCNDLPRSGVTSLTRSASVSSTWSPPSTARCAVGPDRRHRRHARPARTRLLLRRGPGVRGRQGRADRDSRGPSGGVGHPGAADHAGRGAAGRDHRDQLADLGAAVGHP